MRKILRRELRQVLEWVGSNLRRAHSCIPQGLSQIKLCYGVLPGSGSDGVCLKPTITFQLPIYLSKQSSMSSLCQVKAGRASMIANEKNKRPIKGQSFSPPQRSKNDRFPLPRDRGGKAWLTRVYATRVWIRTVALQLRSKCQQANMKVMGSNPSNRYFLPLSILSFDYNIVKRL